MASPRRPALGRGLAALVEASGPAAAGTLHEIALDRIRPNRHQPRDAFDQEALQELAASIRRDGLLQPLVVREDGEGGYELIAGERRWRAAQLVGLERVPVVIRRAGEDDALLLALVENVLRENLNPIEVARGYARLADEFGLGPLEIAERVGKGRVAVANALRLLELPDEVLELLRAGRLTEGHGRAILQAPDHDARRALARRAVAEGLSVRQLEQAARAAAGPAARTRSRRTGAAWFDRDIANDVVDAAYRAVGVSVRVVPTTEGCRIEIPIERHDQLERLLAALEEAAPKQA